MANVASKPTPKPFISLEAKKAFVVQNRRKNYIHSMRLEGFVCPPLSYPDFLGSKSDVIAKYKSYTSS